VLKEVAGCQTRYVVAVRGRRRPLAALAALVALAAVGLSSSGASASSASTILFSEQEAGIQFASSGDDSIGQSIQVNLAADKTPLPRKLAIEIPTGYTLDLDAASGETIAFGSIGVFGVDSSSFAVGSGELVAKDPTSFLADRVAQACAPGVHAAAWELSTTLAGQRVSMKVFVDAGGPPGIAYVLRVCSTGLATGDTDSSAFISLMGLGGLELPTSPGDYRWRVLVTPEIREPYELQALVPLPESVTLKARYDEKRKTALLTGTVVEGGQPVAPGTCLRNGEPQRERPWPVGEPDGRTRAIRPQDEGQANDDLHRECRSNSRGLLGRFSRNLPWLDDHTARRRLHNGVGLGPWRRPPHDPRRRSDTR
jgi:hypothetical protein